MSQGSVRILTARSYLDSVRKRRRFVDYEPFQTQFSRPILFAAHSLSSDLHSRISPHSCAATLLLLLSSARRNLHGVLLFSFPPEVCYSFHNTLGFSQEAIVFVFVRRCQTYWFLFCIRLSVVLATITSIIFVIQNCK